MEVKDHKIFYTGRTKVNTKEKNQFNISYLQQHTSKDSGIKSNAY